MKSSKCSSNTILEHHHPMMLVSLIVLPSPRLAYLQVLRPVRSPLNVNEVRPAPGLHLGREQLLVMLFVLARHSSIAHICLFGRPPSSNAGSLLLSSRKAACRLIEHFAMHIRDRHKHGSEVTQESSRLKLGQALLVYC